MSNKIIKIIALIVIAMILAFATYLYTKKNQEQLHQAYGFVEIDSSKLSFLRQGRINKIFVDEGQFVAKGKVLATLDTSDLQILKQQQEATCKSLQARYQELLNGYTKEQQDNACFTYQALNAQYQLALKTYIRLSKLFKEKQISAQEYDEAKLNKEQLLYQTRSAKAYCQELTIGYRQEQIDASFNNYQQCLKETEYLDYQINTESVLKAPFKGLIRSKNLEIGDLGSPNVYVFEISKSNEKKAIAYLSEQQLALIDKQNTKFFIENEAKERFEAQLIYISDSAEFTPKNVITDELRGLLVYEIKLKIKKESNGYNNLRDGQSVSVFFQ